MRSIYFYVLGTTFLLGGCGIISPTTSSTVSATPTVIDTRQLMEWVIDPTVDVIWDSVKFIENDKGSAQISPKTEAEWDVVRNAAATLAESSNLLMIQGRAREGKRWMEAVADLRAASTEALTAARSKNAMGVFDAGGHIYNACSSCHTHYAQHLQN